MTKRFRQSEHTGFGPDAPRSAVIQHRPTANLKPLERNPRTHSKTQLRQIARSIERFGFTNPVLVDREGGIVAGHGRVEAAKRLGLSSVPTIELEGLSEAEIRAYVIADNRLAELAGWDSEILALELQGLAELDLDFDLTITGFETPEIDRCCQSNANQSPNCETMRLSGRQLTPLGQGS